MTLQTIFIVRTAPIRLVQAFYDGTGYSNVITLSGTEEKMSDWLQEQDCDTLLLGRNEKELDVPRFSALCKVGCVFLPSNLSNNNSKDFVDEFHVDFAYISDKASIDALSHSTTLKATPFENLYRVTK